MLKQKLSPPSLERGRGNARNKLVLCCALTRHALSRRSVRVGRVERCPECNTAMGQSISDEEYVNTLMGSLPPSYDPNISMITTTADMNVTSITPATIIRIITDEYDKHTLRKSKSKSSQDEAFTTDTQKIKKKKKSDVECFNCHKKGHMKSNCWAKGGGKEGQWPKKKDSAKDGAAVAAEKTKDIEAWAAIEEAEESSATMTEESANCITVETKLYDSGVSSHMSPFRDKFVTY